MKVQLNVELPIADVKRVKKDAIEMGVSVATYAQLAFARFLQIPIAQRRVHFDRAKPKRQGRKAKL